MKMKATAPNGYPTPRKENNMKRIISAILAVSLLLSATALFTACGKKGDVPKNQMDEVVSALRQTHEKDTINPEDFSEFIPEGADSDSDNAIYNDEAIDAAVVVNKKSGAVKSVRYTITDALYLDVDGDGTEDVYTIGAGRLEGKVMVSLYRYCKSPFFTEPDVNLSAWAYFDEGENYGLIKGSDGKAHLVTYKGETEKTVVKDFGALTQNGILLETPETSVAKKTSKPDMSIFDIGDEYSVYFNGKKLEGEDVLYRPFENTLDILVDISAIEKASGQKAKAFGKADKEQAIVTVYGKEYTEIMMVGVCFDLDCGIKNKNEFHITTSDYIEPTAVTTTAAAQ